MVCPSLKRFFDSAEAFYLFVCLSSVMGKLLRMGSVSSLVAVAAVCIGVLFVLPLVAEGCPVATYYEPCLSAAMNGNAQPSPACCDIVREMGQTYAGAQCLCQQAHAQTFGAPFQNSVTMPKRCFGANYPNPSGYVCRKFLFHKLKAPLFDFTF